MNNPLHFPNHFEINPELKTLKRMPFHGKAVSNENLVGELHRLLDAWATFYANVANFEALPSRYDLDAIDFFEKLSWWLGYVDHAKGSALIRENLRSHCMNVGMLRGAWGVIHIDGDTLFLSTKGVNIDGYDNPLVAMIHHHGVLSP